MADLKGTNVPSTIVPYTTLDNYATHDEQYGIGGYRTVNTVAEMNAIPSERRKEGMLVNVKGDKIYKLNSSNTFVDAGLGGSGGSEVYYVNIEQLDFTHIQDGDSATQAQIDEAGSCIVYWSQGKTVIYNNANTILLEEGYAGTLNMGFNPVTMVVSFILPFNKDGGDGAFLYMLDTQAASWTVQKLGADDCFNASNLSQNGYVKFQNGLMLQWGNLASSPNNNSTSLYFPVSFKDINYNIQISGILQNTIERLVFKPSVYKKTISFCTFYSYYISSGNPVVQTTGWRSEWFAIGRWK